MRLRLLLGICWLLILTSPACAAPESDTAPVEAIAADSWVLVMLPDIQSYVDHAEHYPLLTEIMEWIAANRDELHLALVVQVGDLVFQNGVPLAEQSSGDQNSTQQWRNVRDAFTLLNGVVPYIVVPGNHDYGIVDADGRYTQFNDYFQPAINPLNDPAQGGILAGLGENAYGAETMENAYYDFLAPDGRRMLFLALEWGPRQATVDWARGIALRDEYADYTKVLVTHAYMYHDDTRFDFATKGKDQGANPHVYTGTSSDTNDGQELWDELVNAAPGFELVLSGHVGGDMVGYLASASDYGRSVHQLLFNSQFLPLGGEGWIRLLEFAADGKTVRVHTFSPYFYQDGDPATAAWRTGPDDEFSFELSGL
ncbi:metallophosphoesterase [bacterium]|nr:metallophosphoesterase [bacterium]